MKAIIWDEASQGMQFEYGEISAELQATAEEWRTNMVEAAAEASEELMDKYLEEGELSKEDIVAGLRVQTLVCQISTNALWYSVQKQRCSTHVGRSN